MQSLTSEANFCLSTHPFHKAIQLQDPVRLLALDYLAHIVPNNKLFKFVSSGLNTTPFNVQDQVQSFIKKLTETAWHNVQLILSATLPFLHIEC